MGVQIRLKFSIRLPRRGENFAFPFPKDFQPLALEDIVVSEPTCAIPPPLFLEELARDPAFCLHIGIGIPENETLPTLSYSDFFNLNANGNLSWATISRSILDKYTTLEREKNSDLPTKFLTSMKKHANNAEGQKSILLFPGRWEGFSFNSAQDLAQKILSETKFNVILIARAHPLSDGKNAQIYMGNSSLSDIETRTFFDSPVGMGEEIFGEVSFNFAHNLRKFFLLKMKKKTDLVFPPLGEAPSMFQTLNIFTPTLYKPPTLSLTGSEIGDDFFLASFSRGEKKVLEALTHAKVHKT